MKPKIAFLFTLCAGFMATGAHAQNTFPATGNVGIGTTTPAALLHVRGSILAENNASQTPTVRNKGFYTWSDNAYGMELHNMDNRWGLSLFARVDSDIRLGHYASGETAQSALNVKMSILYDGRVGIGTTVPSEILHVKGSVLAENSASTTATTRNKGFYTWNDRAFGTELHYLNGKWGTALFTRADGELRLGHYNGGETSQAALNVRMTIQNDGKVVIGNTTTPGTYKLYVEQGILTEKVKVAVKTSGDWADHVFGDQYQPLSISELEKFVRTHKHLPGIPSANEMVQEGNDLGKTDALLLAKIEELTLYIIELKKENDTLYRLIGQQDKKR